MPDDVSPSFLTRIKDVNRTIEAGDLDEATEHLKNMPEHWQARPRYLVSAAKLAFSARNFEEALTSILAARQAGATDQKTLSLQARIQRNLGLETEYIETLNEIARAFPSNSFALRRLAQHHLQQGDLEAARTCAAALPNSTQTHLFQLSLEYQEAVLRNDLPAVSAVLRRVAAEASEFPNLPNLPIVLQELPEPDREELSQKLAHKWPDMAAKLETRRKSLTTLDQDQNRREQAIALALSGNGLEAQRLLKQSNSQGMIDFETIEMIQQLPPEDALRRMPVVDNGDDLIVSAKGDSGTTLLVFTGLSDQPMVPLEFFDRFCAAQGHTVIYIRDAKRCGCMSGIPALAADFEGTIAALTEMLEDLGTQRLLSHGSSLGGFAAIRYGTRLQAERVFAASSPTNMTPEFLAHIGDGRGKLVARRLERTFSATELNLLPEVEASGGQCQIDLWFGNDHAIDANHAAQLSDCPGVTLFPILELENHMSLPFLIKSGAFQEFLAT